MAPTRRIKRLVSTSDEPVTGDEIRARLRRARERGLLTAPDRKGVPGGELTNAAKTVLRKARLL